MDDYEGFYVGGKGSGIEGWCGFGGGYGDGEEYVGGFIYGHSKGDGFGYGFRLGFSFSKAGIAGGGRSGLVTDHREDL